MSEAAESETRAQRPQQPGEVIEALLALLAGPRDADFEDTYVRLVATLVQAEAALMLQSDGGTELPLADWGSDADVAALHDAADAPAHEALSQSGYTHASVTRDNGMSGVVLGVALLADVPTVLWLMFPQRQRANLKEALVRTMLVKDVRVSAAAPSATALTPLTPGKTEPGTALADPGFLDVLALGTEVMQAPRFGAAALALVNGLVRLLGAQQAALCWRMESKARLLAVSHLERFERTSPLVQMLEGAARDVLATDMVVQAERHTLNANEHELPPGHQDLLNRLDDIETLLSLPMRDASGQTHAVVVVALRGPAPNAAWVNNVLLMLEMVYPKLEEAFRKDASLWQRWRYALGRRLEWVLGPSNPWGKAAAVAVAIALLVLTFGRLPYRVEATAQLATDYTRILGAQIDGRVASVSVNVGDRVSEGQLLARMDLTDMRQQRRETQADIQRYTAEEDKARAAGALADAQIARFRREQAQARLVRVDYLLAQSEVRAPFDGVIVEGERKDLLGASLRRGDQMFRVAQVKDLYITAQVAESDVREIAERARGVLVLLSDTQVEIPFEVVKFVPMAQVKGDKGNQFFLKADISAPVADWWRPGMTGLAKVDVGSRNIAWILFHGVIDTLRLKFWW